MPKGIRKSPPKDTFILGGVTYTTINSFWDKVCKQSNCWLWLKLLSSDGYGKLKVNRKTLRAHRVSYALFYGDFNQNLLVCHKCDNPRCVNPNHLFLGTVKDNIVDMVRKNRNTDRKGEKHPLVRLTEEDVINIRKDYTPRKVTQGFLANKYKISKSQIYRIIKGERWHHLK